MSRKPHPLTCFGSTKSFNFKIDGTLKGKIAIKLFKSYPKLKKKPYLGNHFWARGHFVSKVGLEEDMIKKCVKYKEKEEN